MINQLCVEGLSVRFGSVLAVSDVSLTVEPGALVGLIGANGAGKTTTLDALTGFIRATGRARFGGVDLLSLPPHKRAALGVGRTWQSVELFDDLTVAENVGVAATACRFRSVLRETVFGRRGAAQSDVEEVLSDLEVGHVRDRYPEELSEGERKLVGLARTLVSRPKLMLADEPAAGLDSAESRQLGRRLRSLADTGLAILLIDHDMGMVLDVCESIYVLDHGQLLASGPPEEIRRNPAVLAAYLGEDVSPVVDETAAAP